MEQVDWDEIKQRGYMGVPDPKPGAFHLWFSFNEVAHGDHEAEEVARLLAHGDIATSSEVVVWAAKCLIAEGVLQWDRVVFVYLPSQLYLMTNEYGAGPYWPMNLFATGNVLAERTLIAQTKKRKEKRDEK